MNNLGTAATFRARTFIICLVFALFPALPGRADTNDSLALDQYVQQGSSIRIAGVSANASGIAYSPVTKSLFVVINSPTEVVELDLNGKTKRKIVLKGFFDTEGIAHVDGTTFAIADEGTGIMSLIQITDDTKAVDKSSSKDTPVGKSWSNQGLEGVTYARGTNAFFLIKEKAPKKIFLIDDKGKISNPWDAEKDSLHLSDISDLYYHPATGHILILSQESKVLVECTTAGKEISRLKISLSQAEGVTMDDEGRLYICGEPNHLLIFERRPPAKQN